MNNNNSNDNYNLICHKGINYDTFGKQVLADGAQGLLGQKKIPIANPNRKLGF